MALKEKISSEMMRAALSTSQIVLISEISFRFRGINQTQSIKSQDFLALLYTPKALRWQKSKVHISQFCCREKLKKNVRKVLTKT